MPRVGLVQCNPMSVNTEKVGLPIPGVIGDFDLRGDVVDRHSGQVLGCTLPSVNGKAVEHFDGHRVFWVGADTARCNGQGIEIRGEEKNYLHYSLDYANRYWLKADVATIEASPIPAPDGTMTAVRITFSNVLAARLYRTGLSGAGVDTNFHVWIRGDSGARINIENGDLNECKKSITCTGLWEKEDIWNQGVGEATTRIIRRNADDGLVFDLWHSGLGDGKRASNTIATNGAMVTQATEAGSADNGISFDLSKNSDLAAALQDEGTMVLKWVPLFDAADVQNVGLVTCADDDEKTLLYIRSASPGRLQTSDGMVFLSADYAWSAGEELTAVVRWGAGGLKLNNNGIENSNTFDGAFAVGNKITLHWSNELPVEYQSLTFYARSLTDAEVANV